MTDVIKLINTNNCVVTVTDLSLLLSKCREGKKTGNKDEEGDFYHASLYPGSPSFDRKRKIFPPFKALASTLSQGLCPKSIPINFFERDGTMGAIYIGSQRKANKGGLKVKVYFFLCLFVVITGFILKFSAPMIVEEWINSHGAGKSGYAFSVRDVDVSFAKGNVVLKDVKVFNPKSSSRLMEVPNLTVTIDWTELVRSQSHHVSLIADKVDLILSKDFSSEVKRIQSMSDKDKKDFYLDAVHTQVTKLNVIEQKEDQSRTVLELNDVNVKAKELSLLSVNKKTEFTITSNITDGGKMNLKGKTIDENGSTPWSIQGSFNGVPTDLFNKMAGVKLPFTFNESKLNAEIKAESDNGIVIGEILPEVRKLNLLNEKPGTPTQTITRILTDELTFTLPFTLNDVLTLEYGDTFRKLKTYRKDPATIEGPKPANTKVTQQIKAKKSFSFWPF